jgi:hypothetical protein
VNRPATTKDVPPPACTCSRCRAHAAGLGPGPYGAAEYALLAPPVVLSTADDPVSNDPQVQLAEQARGDARSVFDVMNAQWETAVAEHRSAELRGDPYLRDSDGDPVGYRKTTRDPRLPELVEREKDAREARDASWASVVKANERLRQAQLRAWVAAQGVRVK